VSRLAQLSRSQFEYWILLVQLSKRSGGQSSLSQMNSQRALSAGTSLMKEPNRFLRKALIPLIILDVLFCL
jgi:hypothetical protein